MYGLEEAEYHVRLASCIQRAHTVWNTTGWTPEELLQQAHTLLRGELKPEPDDTLQVTVEKTAINFDSVIGLEDVKDYLRKRVINFQNTPRQKELGIEMPKGMLLYGLPGVGKTMIAKALFGELQGAAEYRIVEAHELMDSNVGRSTAKIFAFFREINELARKKRVILVLDEVETIVMKRSTTTTVLAKERTNAMINAIDGMSELSNVFMVCTSNRPDDIDTSFLRSGRIEKPFEIKYPSFDERVKLARMYLGSLEWEINVDLSIIARHTDNYSGADFKKLQRDLFLEIGEPIPLEDAVQYITKYNRTLYKQIKDIKNFADMYSQFETDGTVTS